MIDLNYNKNKWTYTDWDKAGKASKHFDSFKLYVIRCWNEEEEFYKIGKTFNKIEQRFKEPEAMPYQYEIIKELESNSFYISKLESKFHKQLKEHKYSPTKKFEGCTECFTNIKILEDATEFNKTV